MKPKIMIVDDERRMAAALAIALKKTGYDCSTYNAGADALEAFSAEGADVVITDWRMPGMDGMELMKRLHALQPELPVVLITAHADVPSAVAAMREGAFDYVTKPFDNDELRGVVARALEIDRLRRENRWLRQEVGQRFSPDQIVAESEPMQEVLRLCERAASSPATVLIQGESGTGKELIAKCLHFWSPRLGGPFIAVNCKAFAEGVLESELFGHEQGAFTGARAARAGCFERADSGSLFLDEIGEVSLEFQAKLLRVLQEREVLRVGGSQPRPIDVRVIAATNRDLVAEVEAGRFREDLFFRLNVVPVKLPPLRARPKDVLPLAQRFLERYLARDGRRLSLSEEAVQALSAHPWPGNVREVENAIERAVVLARGKAIEPEDLLLSQAPGVRKKTEPQEEDSQGSLQESMDRAAELRIKAALAEAQGRRAEAAKALGVDRTTLYRMMKRLGMDEGG